MKVTDVEKVIGTERPVLVEGGAHCDLSEVTVCQCDLKKKKKVFFEFSLKHLFCSDFSQSDWPVVGVVCSQTVTVSLQRYLTSKWPLFCSPR